MEVFGGHGAPVITQVRFGVGLWKYIRQGWDIFSTLLLD
jgi:hypothetical protein